MNRQEMLRDEYERRTAAQGTGDTLPPRVPPRPFRSRGFFWVITFLVLGVILFFGFFWKGAPFKSYLPACLRMEKR